MTKGNRVEALINYYGNGKPGEFARLLGVTPSTISSWKARNTFDMELVFAKCENVSPSWLLTGEGEMLKKDESPSQETLQTSRIIANEVCLSQARIPEITLETRPRIPFDAAAGTLSTAINSVTANDCEQVPIIPTFPRYDFSIVTRGDSMTPEFMSGDELACAFVKEKSFIQWGRAHILDTAQGVVLKKIFDRKTAILCRSNNPDYPDFEVPKDEIYHMAIVVGLLRHF